MILKERWKPGLGDSCAPSMHINFKPSKCSILQVLKLNMAGFRTLSLPAGLVACSRLKDLVINHATVGAASIQPVGSRCTR